MKDIEANLRLSGDNNAALWIHSQAESDEMEEVHAELNQIDLGGYLQRIQLYPADERYIERRFPVRSFRLGLHGRGGYEH